MIITDAPGKGKTRPRCTHSVYLAKDNTREKLNRIEAARRAGYDPATCGMPSAYLVDGNPRCMNHAGQDAVAHFYQLTPKIKVNFCSKVKA